MITRAARTAALAAVCACLTLPARALAHAGVKSYSPKPGSTVGRDLARVKVVMKGRIADGKLTVATAGGAAVSRGDGTVSADKRKVKAVLRGGLKAGRYKATLRVLNADGHVQTRTWSFTLR